MKSRGWVLPFALLMFAVLAVPLHLAQEQGLPRYHALKSELGRVEASNGQLRREIRDLRRRVRALKTDPAAVEKIAREELGMIRRGEIIIQF